MDPAIVLALGVLSLLGQIHNYGIDSEKFPHLKEVRVKRHIEPEPSSVEDKYEKVQFVPHEESPLDYSQKRVKDIKKREAFMPRNNLNTLYYNPNMIDKDIDEISDYISHQKQYVKRITDTSKDIKNNDNTGFSKKILTNPNRKVYTETSDEVYEFVEQNTRGVSFVNTNINDIKPKKNKSVIRTSVPGYDMTVIRDVPANSNDRFGDEKLYGNRDVFSYGHGLGSSTSSKEEFGNTNKLSNGNNNNDNSEFSIANYYNTKFLTSMTVRPYRGMYNRHTVNQNNNNDRYHRGQDLDRDAVHKVHKNVNDFNNLESNGYNQMNLRSDNAYGSTHNRYGSRYNGYKSQNDEYGSDSNDYASSNNGRESANGFKSQDIGYASSKNSYDTRNNAHVLPSNAFRSNNYKYRSSNGYDPDWYIIRQRSSNERHQNYNSYTTPKNLLSDIFPSSRQSRTPTPSIFEGENHYRKKRSYYQQMKSQMAAAAQQLNQANHAYGTNYNNPYGNINNGNNHNTNTRDYNGVNTVTESYNGYNQRDYSTYKYNVATNSPNDGYNLFNNANMTNNAHNPNRTGYNLNNNGYYPYNNGNNNGLNPNGNYNQNNDGYNINNNSNPVNKGYNSYSNGYNTNYNGYNTNNNNYNFNNSGYYDKNNGYPNNNGYNLNNNQYNPNNNQYNPNNNQYNPNNNGYNVNNNAFNGTDWSNNGTYTLQRVDELPNGTTSTTPKIAQAIVIFGTNCPKLFASLSIGGKKFCVPKDSIERNDDDDDDY